MRTFLLALVVALSAIGISGHAHAACPTPNPNNSPGSAPNVHLQDNCTVPAATLNTLFNAAASVQAATRAVLLTTPTTTPAVQVLGYTSAGDGGGGVYNITAASCANPDGGAQVSLTGGGCAIIDPVQSFVTPLVWGAIGNGSNNDTTAVQAAFTWAARTHQTLYLGPYSYLVTPTLNIIGTMKLVGIPNSSFIIAASGASSNIIDVGYQSGQVNDVVLEGFTIKATSPAGGYAISSHNVGRLFIHNIRLGTLSNGTDAPFGGIDDEYSNTDMYDGVWGYTQGTNSQAFKWYSLPATGRSDQLSVHNIFINSDFYGNDGFVWDGMTNTLDMVNAVFLQDNHGFWIKNSGSYCCNSQFPQFAEIYDLQVEGAQTAACEVDAGRQIYFIHSFCTDSYGETGPGGSQGNADTASLVITPDGAGATTSDIQFIGGAIGLSGKQAAVVDAQGVKFVGTTFRGSSLSSANSYPSVELEKSGSYGSADYQFDGVKFCGGFGDTLQNNYGLIRDTSVDKTVITNADFNYCTVGSVQDNSTNTNLVVSGSVDQGGTTLPPSAGIFVGNGTPVVSSCGTSPSPTISGNNLNGQITVGGSAPTSCTVTFASTNSAANNGLGLVKAVMMTATTTGSGAIPYVSALSATAFSFARNDSGSMAGETFYYHVSQGSN